MSNTEIGRCRECGVILSPLFPTGGLCKRCEIGLYAGGVVPLPTNSCTKCGLDRRDPMCNAFNHTPPPTANEGATA